MFVREHLHIVIFIANRLIDCLLFLSLREYFINVEIIPMLVKGPAVRLLFSANCL